MRKTLVVFMLLSGIFSACVVVFTIVRNCDFIRYYLSQFFSFNIVHWVDFWAPVASGAIGLIFIILGLCAIWRREKWWLAFIGAIFALVTPFVWDLWPVSNTLVIPRFIGCNMGIITIILILCSKKDFQRC